MLLTWIEFDGMELNGKSYPGWAEGLGWFIELVPVSIAVLGRTTKLGVLQILSIQNLCPIFQHLLN